MSTAAARTDDLWARFLAALPDGDDVGERERVDFLLELLIQLTCRTPLERDRPPLATGDLTAFAERLRVDWFGS